jgi:hypothetical protein
MAFNITNLVNAVNAKSVTVGADSALDRAVLLTNDIKNASIYSSLDDLPTADSSNSGRLSRVGDANDANTKYYVSHRDRWNLIGLDDSDVATEGQFIPFQGSNYGYASGATGIEQFSFTSDGNATDVGDLSTADRYQTVGQSSATHGYNTGGIRNPPPVIGSNIIDKFPFTSGFTTATDVGNLTVGKLSYHAGHSSIRYGFGYTSGGASPQSNPQNLNVIDKFPFASDDNASDVGDLTVARTYIVGQSSSTHGYTSGGPNAIIDKFSFATNGNATDVGDLTVARWYLAGQSSSTHGYTSGGQHAPGAYLNVIDKFPFSTDANATDAGDLTGLRSAVAGQSSTVSGYNSGGSDPTGGALNIIEKFPFTSGFTTATDVGDLTVVRGGLTGQQY